MPAGLSLFCDELFYRNGNKNLGRGDTPPAGLSLFCDELFYRNGNKNLGRGDTPPAGLVNGFQANIQLLTADKLKNVKN